MSRIERETGAVISMIDAARLQDPHPDHAVTHILSVRAMFNGPMVPLDTMTHEEFFQLVRKTLTSVPDTDDIIGTIWKFYTDQDEQHDRLDFMTDMGQSVSYWTDKLFANLVSVLYQRGLHKGLHYKLRYVITEVVAYVYV